MLDGDRDANRHVADDAGHTARLRGPQLAAPLSPIHGTTPRLVALLGYDTKPGTMSSELLKAVRYGRTTMMQIGEGFAGDGVNAAHVNSMLGAKDGPVGAAWATALAMPRAGHTPFVVVGAAQRAGEADDVVREQGHGRSGERTPPRLTWGAAQAGVAAGVIAAYGKGILHESEADDLVLVTAVWVDPAADDEEAVYANNAEATLAAVTAGRHEAPSLSTLFDVREPENPYFRS